MPLPMPARALLESLRDGALDGGEAIRAQGEAQLRNPAEIPSRRRAIQMGVCALLPVFLPIVVVAALHLLQRIADERSARRTLSSPPLNRLAAIDEEGPNLTAKDREQRDAIEIYIAEHLQEAVAESAAVAPTISGRQPGSAASMSSRRSAHRQPSTAVARAGQEGGRGGREAARRTNRRGLSAITTLKAQWAIVLVITGVLVRRRRRDGPHRLAWSRAAASRSVRSASRSSAGDGSRASRLRAFARALVAFSPHRAPVCDGREGPAASADRRRLDAARARSSSSCSSPAPSGRCCIPRAEFRIESPARGSSRAKIALVGHLHSKRHHGPRRPRAGPQASRHVHRRRRQHRACTTSSGKSSTTRSTRR